MATFSRRTLLALALVAAISACNGPQPAAAVSGSDAAAPAGIVAEAKQTAIALADAATPLGPRAQVERALAELGEASSFEAVMLSTMSMSKDQVTRTELQYVAPDRFRISAPMGTHTVIGRTSYTDFGGHTSISELDEAFDPELDDVGMDETTTVELLGAESVDGAPAIRYLVSKGEPDPEEITMWVGADGFPIQMRSEQEGMTATVRYTRVNDPSIRIEPPQ